MDNCETIRFIYLDLNFPINHDFIEPLQSINNDVQIFNDTIICLNFLQNSNEKCFLIASLLNDKEFLDEIHDYSIIEGIFLYNSNIQIEKKSYSKLIGIYQHFQQLVTDLKNVYEWFEQIKFDFFVFEYEPIFLWYQMWREFIKPINPQVTSSKDLLIHQAEKFYRENIKFLKSIDDFDYCYEQNDVLQWCFSSPFPSHFLHHALSSRHMQHISLCHFLIDNISHVLQQSINYQENRHFYKGLKVTNEGLEKLLKQTGKLICPKGYLTCTKSQKKALASIKKIDYRLDLKPVLFKINCPPSIPIGEVSMPGRSELIVFDVYTAFRIKSIHHGSITIVKLEPAETDGRNLALEFRMKCKTEKVQTILEQLSNLPTAPQHSERSPRTITRIKSKIGPKIVRSLTFSNEEKHADRLVKHGKIDEALSIYKNLKSQTPRLLKTIAQLYIDRKGDYYAAVEYYKQLIKMQEENGDDITETLTQLGIIYQNCREYNLALTCHNHALNLLKTNNKTNPASTASCLIGVANAQWSQGDLNESLKNAQQALILNESIPYGNDLNLAMNLAVLANIYHKIGNDSQALNCAQRALTILECCLPADSLTLASILNNIGAIQRALGLFSDARYSLDRAVKICEKILPPGHPKRVTMEHNVQYDKTFIETNDEKK